MHCFRTRAVTMRGSDRRTGELFSYVDLKARVRSDHPLRVIRTVANEALAAMGVDFAVLTLGSVALR